MDWSKWNPLKAASNMNPFEKNVKDSLLDQAKEWNPFKPKAEPTPQEMAKMLIKKGIAVIPVDKDKKPLVKWKLFRERIPTEAEIHRWFEKFPDANIAIVPGKNSGIIAIDSDSDAATKKLWKAFPENPLYQKTRRGYHVLFRHPDGDEIKKEVRFAPDLDLIAGGGLLTFAPSLLNDGTLYALVDKNGDPIDFSDLPGIIDELPVLTRVDIKRLAPDKAKGKSQKRQRGSLLDTGETSNSYFNTVLDDQYSNVINAQQGSRNDTLNKAAFKLGQYARSIEDQQRTYNALLDAAMSIGMPEKEARPTIDSGFESGMADPQEPGELRKNSTLSKKKGKQGQEQSATDSNPETQIKPIPFDRPYPPPLAADLLPPALSNLVTAMAEDLQISRNFAFAVVLVAASTACQGRYQVQVRKGHIEPCNLYIMSAMEPGERKSGAVGRAKAPIEEWEKEASERLSKRIAKHNYNRNRLLAQIEDLKDDAYKADDFEADAIFDEIADLEAELTKPVKAPSVFVEDTTPEGLLKHAFYNMGMASHFEAEGGLFDKLIARKESGTTFDFILKSYNGEPVKKTRATQDEMVIERPLMTIGIFPQPEVLRDIAVKGMFRGKGLLARFLYFVAESHAGTRKTVPDDTPDEVTNAYADAIKPILNVGYGKDFNGELAPYTLTLSDDAYKAWVAFAGEIEPELIQWGKLGGIADWGNKLAGTMARLAGIIHAVNRGSDCHKQEIPASTMEKATALGRALVDHALWSFNDMGIDKENRCARRILNRLELEQVDEVTQREAYEWVKGTADFKKVATVAAGLRILEEHRYLTKLPGNGTRTKRFKVNQAIYDD